MTYLLDTCVISKLRKITKYPDPSLQDWIKKHQESQFFLSILTIGEIQQGITKLDKSKQKRILEEWLKGELIPRFQDRILTIDFKVASKWGELSGFYSKKGKPLPVIDSLIASTAIVHDLIVVTENIKDFSRIEQMKLFSPWES